MYLRCGSGNRHQDVKKVAEGFAKDFQALKVILALMKELEKCQVAKKRTTMELLVS